MTFACADSATWEKAREDIEQYCALSADGKRDYMKVQIDGIAHIPY